MIAEDDWGEKLYIRLYRLLRERIESGEWQLGEAIPTEKELGRYYGVSMVTVRAAISPLSSEGYLTKRQGKGTFIRSFIGKAPAREHAGKLLTVNNPLAVISEKAGWMEDLLGDEDGKALRHYEEYVDILKKIRREIAGIRDIVHGMTELPQKLEALRKKYGRAE